MSEYRRPSARGRVVLPILAALLAVASWQVYVHAQSTNTRIPASLLIARIAAHYGEGHPLVLQLESGPADSPPNEPIYDIRLGGTFRRGKARADELDIAATADRLFIWGVTAYAGSGRHHDAVWTDCQQKPCTSWSQLPVTAH